MITDLVLLANRRDGVSRRLDEHPAALGLIAMVIGGLFVAVGFSRYRALGLPDAPPGTRPVTSYLRIATGLGFIGWGIYVIATNWS